jgi:hypothetical protein
LSESGISFSFTYGSDEPFGSIGIRFLPWRTARKREKKALIITAQAAPSSVSVLGGSLGAADKGWSYSLVTGTSTIRSSVRPRRPGGPHSKDHCAKTPSNAGMLDLRFSQRRLTSARMLPASGWLRA